MAQSPAPQTPAIDDAPRQTGPVVVGIDETDSAYAAVDWACAQAKALNAPLRLVHAFVWPQLHVDPGPSDVAPGLRAAEEQLLHDVQAYAKERFDGDIETALVDGFATPVLVNESKAARLLVIGGRGLGAILRVIVGSTGYDLASLSACPVVVLRPGGVKGPDTDGHEPVIIAGYDGSPASERAVEFALQTAQAREWSLTVVYVRRPGRVTHDEERVHRGLDEQVLTWRERYPGVKIWHSVLEGTNPAAPLLQTCTGAELVVVGSRGGGGFAGLLLGSLSHAMLAHAPCAVAVVPDPSRTPPDA